MNAPFRRLRAAAPALVAILAGLFPGRSAAEELVHSVGDTLAGSAINGWVDTSAHWNIAAVPEPGTIALLVAGAAALACGRQIRNRRSRRASSG